MFGIDSGELLIIAVVALVIIGPKDLPRVMRTVGQWVGRARGMARHFRSGLDTMMREAELEDMEKKWREQNEFIMRSNPLPPGATEWSAASPSPPADVPSAPDIDRPRPPAASAPAGSGLQPAGIRPVAPPAPPPPGSELP